MRALWMLAALALAGSGCSCGKSNSPPPAATGDGGAATGDGGMNDGGEPCVPDCVGRVCGGDGCGGKCAPGCTMPALPTCDETSGLCVAQCTPKCEGKNCGDDSCGGSCGTCTGALTCSSIGLCVPPAWTCAPSHYGTHDECDCACGAPDPDCSDKSLPVAGCPAHQMCGSDGKCAPIAPSSWTCDPGHYATRDACDCACGAVDPDCAISGLPVRGCVGRNASCQADATCACTRSCGTRVCGDDGCGGTCGSCSDPTKPLCLDGACVSACDPDPIRCHFAVCGSNECGGSCGTCGPGSSCKDGACVTVKVFDPLSCDGQCGNLTAGGCSCAADCTSQGSSCADYPATCGNCLPACAGRACGPDGCGGSCGACGSGVACSAGLCITGCQKSCSGRQCGDDGCGGSCGACPNGSSCQFTGQCVPDPWFCDASEYSDGTFCHCGCGAVDPNCSAAGAIVSGCATGGSTCSAAGLCSDKPCAKDGDCGTGRVCAGTYYQGNARFSGSCATSPGGSDVGQSCTFGASCATGLCAEGLCRSYCTTDGDCPGAEACVALPLRDLAGDIEGFASVCELIPGRDKACTAQKDCTPQQQACIATLLPSTLAPRFECANAPGTLGTRCDVASCPGGQMCVSTASGKVCTLPCPAGAADCPNGWHCGSLTYSSASFTTASSAPTVPVCLPN